MVTWYGLMPMNVTQHIEIGDRWYNAEGVWTEWNGRVWKELNLVEV